MHAHTRPTQIKNRCMMAGKGRGVMRDFRMARVRIMLAGAPRRCRALWITDVINNVVSVQIECPGGAYSWCEKGELVEV